MEEIEFKLKEINTRISNLKKFVTGEFTEVISNRFLFLEEELNEFRKTVEKKLKEIEEKLRELETKRKDEREYIKALEKMSRKIDKSILRELE